MDKSKKNSPFRYSLGIFGLAIPVNVSGFLLQTYYVEKVGISLGLIATVMTFYSVWAAVNDPVLGWMSDSTRSRFGRRKPWLLGTTPLYFLSMIFLFSAELVKGSQTADQLSNNALFIAYFVFVMFINEAFSTVIWQNYGVLHAELFHSEDKIRKVANLTQILQMVGVLVATLCAPLLLEVTDSYTLTIAILSIVGGGILIYSVLGVHEDLNIATQKKVPFIKSMMIAVKCKGFLPISLVGAFSGLSASIVISSIAIYGKYALGIGDNMISVAILMGSALLIVLPMIAVWSVVIKKIGAIATFITSLAISVVCSAGFLVANDLITGIIASAFFAVGYAGAMVSSSVISTMVLKKHTIDASVNNEAVFNAMKGFIGQFMGSLRGIAVWLLTPLFGFVSGDNPGNHPVDAWRFAMSVLPCAFAVLTLIVIAVWYKTFKYYEKLQ